MKPPPRAVASKQNPYVARTVNVRVDQDRWLTEFVDAPGGNVSQLFRSLLDGAIAGKLPATVSPGAGNSRVTDYLRAKAAALNFEEDVGAVLRDWATGRRGVAVSEKKLHNGDGVVYVADFSVEMRGEVVLSVGCKSSPRSDRLHLALAEAMIGRQKTGKPVVTVVPYLLDESRAGVAQFEAMGYEITELRGLAGVLVQLIGGKPGKQ